MLFKIFFCQYLTIQLPDVKLIGDSEDLPVHYIEYFLNSSRKEVKNMATIELIVFQGKMCTLDLTG